MSAEEKNHEWVLGVRMTKILCQGPEREFAGNEGDGHLSYLNVLECLKELETAPSQVHCLLGKSPDYFMRIREGAHIPWLSVFSKF